jgi:8-oxo-dGTP pyrophosphatase MutT (NUDIX family)
LNQGPYGVDAERLPSGAAVAALIIVETDGYLMQLRDSRPDIWYPSHWGLFGGSVNPDENSEQALARELREELELEVREPQLFARSDVELTGLEPKRYFRLYYLVPITRAVCRSLVLHEGAEMRVFAGEEILRQPHVTPMIALRYFSIMLGSIGGRRRICELVERLVRASVSVSMQFWVVRL